MAGFQDIIGQEQICEHLQTALKLQKVSHAYIINGERNSGKKFIARIFAMALQCTGEGEKPCQVCRSCRQALSENHPDIIRITHEKPNSIGVEDIRTQVNNDMGIKPYQGPYKVYLMEEAEKMTVQAQNALLKTLEEPPEYGVIILMTSSLEALLPTIQSRCVLLNMRPVRDELVQKYLMEQLQVPDYRAKLCTAFVRGNIGQAKLLASSEDFDRVREEAVTLLKYINEMEITELAAAVRKITEYQLDMTDYLDIISVWYRDVLMFKAMNDANHLIFREEIQYIKRVADRSSYEGLEKILDALEKAKARLRANVSFELTMELLFLTIQENT
mgnify:CR=1 FL=1